MRINIVILLCLVCTTALWTYFSNNNNAPPTQQRATQLFQNFTFQQLQNGQETQKEFYDLKGKSVLVHFWASWCAPCLEELPQLIKLSQNNPELVILAIAVKDKPEDIERFLNKISKDVPSNFIIGLDSDKTISSTIFNTTKLPETYMLKPDLSLFEKVIGAQENWEDAWRQLKQSNHIK